MTQLSSMTAEKQYLRAVYLDMEWTCWDSTPPEGMQQEIIEIGIVAMDLNELKILDEASYFVRPRRWEISLKCTQLTGITHEDIRGARPLGEVLAALTERFQPKGIPCCTWGEDASVLARACRSIGHVNPFVRSIDLSGVFQGAFATKERIGLRAATEMLTINFDGFAHGALPDARNTALIHASILRRLRQSQKQIHEPVAIEQGTPSLSHFGRKLSDCLKK
jgi:inhibitor of KinA sporulation pathway (predicted exonuclease)